MTKVNSDTSQVHRKTKLSDERGLHAEERREPQDARDHNKSEQGNMAEAMKQRKVSLDPSDLRSPDRSRGRSSMSDPIIIDPFFARKRDDASIDVTETVINAISREISRRYGGNEVLNQLEAELLFEQHVAAREQRLMGGELPTERTDSQRTEGDLQ